MTKSGTDSGDKPGAKPGDSRADAGLKWDPASTRFDVVVRTYQDELYSTAIRLLGAPISAEEALQETFLKAYRALDRLKPGSKLRPWLYRILMNTAYDQLDRRKTRTRASLKIRDEAAHVEPQYDVQVEVETRDLQRQVADAIATLAPRYRDALMLRSVQGLSYAEIALALDVRETTARSLVHRGKRLLVPKVQHLFEDLEP